MKIMLCKTSHNTKNGDTSTNRVPQSNKTTLSQKSSKHITIFIDDADLLSVCVPFHSSHNRFVSIVYHLLVPWTWRQNCGPSFKFYPIYMYVIRDWLIDEWPAKTFALSKSTLILFCITFVKHPDDNESILVTGGQFMVVLIPCQYLDSPYQNIKKVRYNQNQSLLDST